MTLPYKIYSLVGDPTKTLVETFKAVIFVWMAGSIAPLPCMSQEGSDVLQINNWLSEAESQLFQNRAQTLLFCDSIERVARSAHRIDWQLRALSIRIESADIFANVEVQKKHLTEMDSALTAHRDQLGNTYWDFWENNQYTWGAYYQKMGNLTKSQTVFLGLKTQIETKPNLEIKHYKALFATQQYIAGNYMECGDHDKAIEHYLQSLQALTRYSKTSIGYVNALYKIGDIYALQKQPDKALDFYYQALDSLNKAIGNDGAGKWFAYGMNLHRRLGSYFAAAGHHNFALEHFQQAINFTSKESPFYAYILENMGAAYVAIDQSEKAKEYYDLALGQKEKLYGKNTIKIVETYLQIGQMYANQNLLEQAMPWYQKSLEVLGISTPMALSSVQERSNGVQLFQLKSLTAYLVLLDKMQAQNPENDNLSSQIGQTLETGLILMDQIRNELRSASDKQTLMGCYRVVFELGIKYALSIPQHTLMYIGKQTAKSFPFYASEKTKALLLYEGNQRANALKYGHIPAVLLSQESELRIEIAYLDKQRFALENQGFSIIHDTMLSLNNSLYKRRREHENLQKTFEADYADYFCLKYNVHLKEISTIQQDLLQPDQALVEYFVGDSSIFIFCIWHDRDTTIEIKKDFPLEVWVAQLRTGLTDFFINPDMANHYDQRSLEYTEAAFLLYQKLIAPIGSKLPSKVVFIPDGVLGYLPFELLLAEMPTDPIRWNTHHYLQKDHTISYGYSATMLHEMNQRKHLHVPSIPFLGYAPQYLGDNIVVGKYPLKPLPYSGAEVLETSKIMNGRAVVNDEATEANFLITASQARIIHLATHGQSNSRNGDYCYLVFSEIKDGLENEILYARDIYNLSLNADLVTLSACETGIGELQGGEGVISLARAFAYAGAKSIMTSLWSVSDAKTKDLMINFYQNIHEKMPKDEALRKAKMDYLKHSKGISAHPFYWAGFVGIGDMKRME